ncbi:hypothetical protein ACOMHN_056617 [Nucella lapillus]
MSTWRERRCCASSEVIEETIHQRQQPSTRRSDLPDTPWRKINLRVLVFLKWTQSQQNISEGRYAAASCLHHKDCTLCVSSTDRSYITEAEVLVSHTRVLVDGVLLGRQ